MHKAPPDYPRAEKVPHVIEKHGDQRNDPYFWLRNRESRNVIDHLNAENAYAARALEPVKELETKLFEEMKRRTKDDDSTVPFKKGDYFYYSRYEKGQQYPIHARRKQSMSSPEEILLDVNVLAQGKSFCETSRPIISPDQMKMAYAVDFVGRRFFDIYFKDLKTGQVYSQKIEKVSGDAEWAKDSNTVFYVQQNKETLRSEKVLRFDLKKNLSTVVYFEKDETFSVGLYKSLTENYIYIGAYSTLTTEIRYLASDKPHDDFNVFHPRSAGLEYSVTDGADAFYIISNRDAKNYKLSRAPFGATAPRFWQDVVPHDEKVYISGVTVFENFVALEERRSGLTHVQIYDKNFTASHPLTFDDKSYVVELEQNFTYATNLLRYKYKSMRTPDTTFDYDMVTRARAHVHTREVPNFDSGRYVTERVFITARDGARVPVSIIMKKDTPKNNSAPLLIYGYGSYGANMEPWFSQSIFSLVDRGFIYAIAHIRGGSEMGREWFDNGRVLNKKNSFYDFIDATESLVTLGFADRKKIYAMGGSAGGLLMGAVANMRPDLYKGMVAQVAFVDVITTMLDETIPLTTGEYDQWGNPNEKIYYDYIKSYSPYDNVTAQAYPHMLITTGLHDSQVQYWEPAKWAAKLRELKTDDHLILLKTDMESGHGGASGRFGRMREIATEYAFILMIENNY